MAKPLFPWRSPLVALPDSGSAIWIRRVITYDTPVQATADYTADFVFMVSVNGNATNPAYYTLFVPDIDVQAWRFQNLADEQAFVAT